MLRVTPSVLVALAATLRKCSYIHNYRYLRVTRCDETLIMHPSAHLITAMYAGSAPVEGKPQSQADTVCVVRAKYRHITALTVLSCSPLTLPFINASEKFHHAL